MVTAIIAHLVKFVENRMNVTEFMKSAFGVNHAISSTVVVHQDIT